MESEERTILVPKKKFLTTEEACVWLTVSEDIFKRAVKHHRLGPAKAWKGKHQWHWRTIFFLEELIVNFDDSENPCQE